MSTLREAITLLRPQVDRVESRVEWTLEARWAWWHGGMVLVGMRLSTGRRSACKSPCRICRIDLSPSDHTIFSAINCGENQGSQITERFAGGKVIIILMIMITISKFQV